MVQVEDIPGKWEYDRTKTNNLERRTATIIVHFQGVELVVARWTPELSSLTSSPSSLAKICHRDSTGPPPDVRMVARWTLESSASISDPSFSLLSNNVSQPSQPGILNNGGRNGGDDGESGADNEDDNRY